MATTKRKKGADGIEDEPRLPLIVQTAIVGEGPVIAHCVELMEDPDGALDNPLRDLANRLSSSLSAIS